MVESVEVDASQAITLYLKHYPGQNKAEFDTFYGEAGASAARTLVRKLLDEVTNLQPSWADSSLNDAGDYVAMRTGFVSDVENRVGSALTGRGFVLEESFEGTDEGGRGLSVAYYRNTECKIQIYSWEREGEANCMIGPLDAPNEFGLLTKTKRWQFLTRFAERPDLSLAETTERARMDYESYDHPLEWVRNRIEAYYDIALRGLPESSG